MKKTIMRAGSLICFLVFAGAMTVAEGQVALKGKSEVLQTAKEQLKERTLSSGTLDIYDAGINKVRNLRRIKFQDNVVENDEGYVILGDCRDVATGEIVTIEIVLLSEEDGFVIDNVRIKNVAPSSQEEGDKEYTDQQIQDFMLEYVEKQGKFNDGKVMLFDKDARKMRNLKLQELKKEVRRVGIFYSSSSIFLDTASNETLDIDIAVEKKKGKLRIQALRIRGVKNGSL